MDLSSALSSDVSSRRKATRYGFARRADWDFFSAGSGAKPGFLENLSEGGCLLRTTEPIEHRRWIRLVVKDPQRSLWFTAVGRIVRREDRMEAWDDHNVTLYRYGVQFIHALNPVVLEKVRADQSACCVCGEPAATIPDLKDEDLRYCVLCHLRRACHNLLVQEDEIDTTA